MANINEILARAAALRNETALNSIDPERAGGIMYDTLIALNELWLQQGAALVLSKIYASVAAMNADTSPVSDLTGKPIRPGMVVVIASSDSDNGSVYRYNGTSSPSWSLVGKIGNLEPEDSLDSDSTQLPLAARQGKVLDGKISQLGQFRNDAPFVRVVTDANNKILYGVLPDGDFYFGAGVPTQIISYVLSVKNTLDADVLAEQVRAMAVEATKVDKVEGKSLIDADYASAQGTIDNPEYLELTTDKNNKIIEGITRDGIKKINVPVDTPAAKFDCVECHDWAEVKTDKNGKIIEGITRDGKKRIGDFDDETKDVIRGFIEPQDAVSGVLRIPALDANFASPVPVTITGTKGDANAKYEFQVPLKEAWNIRAKFKITEDILRANKTATIASINGAAVIAYPLALSQCITDSDNKIAIDLPYDGPYFENKWPAYSGGICFNTQSKDVILDKMNIGRQAFSVRYIGGGSSASVANDGTALTFTIDGTTKTFSFATYPTVNELFEAINTDSDFEVVAIAIDYHNSSELAVFTSVQLISTLHGNTNQAYHAPIIEYSDNGPLYLHYSVNEDWHQIEIAKVGDKVYSVCDGNVVEYTELTEENVLTLGGGCGVLFKDVEIHTDSAADFEFVTVPVINFSAPLSEVNPYIVIFEAHATNLYPTYQQPEYGPQGYNLTIDTLDYVFSWCKSKGYVPVSIHDIEDYYIFGKPLPKRCYTIVFDGWPWDDATEIRKRAIFLKYGVKPALAIEKRPSATVAGITHNGQPITIEEAVRLAEIYGFDIINHTINHTSTYAVKPSDRIDFVTAQVYDFETDGIDGQSYVFPGGATDPYMTEVLEYLGMRSGIEIEMSPEINVKRNRFALGRINISTVYTKKNGEWIKINFTPSSGRLIKVI